MLSTIRLLSSIGFLLITACTSLLAQDAQQLRLDRELARVEELRKQDDLVTAWAVLETLRASRPMMSDWQRGRYERLLGTRSYHRRDFEESYRRYWEARRFFRRIDADSARKQVVNTFTNVGVTLYVEGAYEEAADTLARGLEQAASLPDSLAATVLPYVYNTLANIQERTEDFDAALQNAQQCLALLARVKQDSSRSAAIAHTTVGNILRRRGRYETSTRAYLEAAGIFKNLYGESHRYYQSAIGNAALNARSLGEIDRVIGIFERKLQLLLEDPESDQAVLTNTYLNLGTAHAQVGDLQRAEQTLALALSTWRKSSPRAHLKELNILRNLGDVILAQGRADEVRHLSRSALQLQSQLGLVGTGEHIALLDLRGRYLLAVDSLDRAAEAFGEAAAYARGRRGGYADEVGFAVPAYIAALIQQERFEAAEAEMATSLREFASWRDSLNRNEALDAQVALGILKARLLVKSAPDAPIQGDFVAQLDSLATAFNERITQLRGRANKRFLATQAYGPSALLRTLAGVLLHNHMLSESSDDALVRRAVHYIGQELAYIRAASQLARDNRLSPGDQRRARRLADQVVAFEELLTTTSSRGRDAEMLRATYRDSIISLEEELQSLVAQSASSQPLQTAELSPTSPAPYSLIVFSANDLAYAITSAQGSYHVTALGGADGLKRDITAYNALLRDPNLGFGESRLALEAGTRLHQKLLVQTNLAKQADNRTIRLLATRELAHLPLAALPAELDSASGFRQLDYALKHHRFAYHNSLASLFSESNGERAWWQPNITAVAPMTTSATAAEPAYDQLPGADVIVDVLRSRYSASALVGAKATARALANAAGSTDILHLATHARSEPRDGRYSYVVLADTSDQKLVKHYAASISKEDYPVRLVVLSACESGDGTISAGEGSVSLASVFLEAGASSAINTLWRVDDRQSAVLGEYLYEALHEGQSLDRALTQGQLQYLQNEASQFTHPYYWAGFTLLGDTAPIVRPRTHLAAVGLGGLIAAGLLLLGYRSTFGRHATAATT